MIRLLLLLLSVGIFQGCAREHMAVQLAYLSGEDLASTVVHTPDYRQCECKYGQQLIVTWCFYRSDFDGLQPLSVSLKVRFYNQEEDTVSFNLVKRQGCYTYYLLNDDFIDTGGILTYKAELLSAGQVIETWQHQLWTDLITVGCEKDQKD